MADFELTTVSDPVENKPEISKPPVVPGSAAATSATAAAATSQQRVRWNTQSLKSSYVNFANANSTREEVVLNFGLNNTWDRAQTELEIELAHRIVMSPFAAKRLSELLTRLIDEYESRHGKLT